MILDTVQGFHSEPEKYLVDRSHAAQDLASRIVADVSRFYLEHRTLRPNDTLPIYCPYNVQTAMAHLKERRNTSGAQRDSVEFDWLLAYENKFYRGWTL